MKINLRVYLLIVSSLGLCVGAPKGSTASAQTHPVAVDAPSSSGAPTAEQIVGRLDESNRLRAAQLKSYSDDRHYTVTYHGFPATLTASMMVEATYDAPTTKHFHIVSQSGSALLINHVLKKLLEAERDAARDPDKTALTPANYTFRLLSPQTVEDRQCYVLQVTPKFSSKFLYRGKIYVDIQSYAVVQIDAEPAKNPSFWIKNTEIHHLYATFGPFWLPERDLSKSALRTGTAVLTIDYGSYSVQSADSR